MDEDAVRNVLYRESIQNMDCFQHCIYNISNKDLFFACLSTVISWGFLYTGNSQTIGKCIEHPTHIYVNTLIREQLNMPISFFSNKLSFMDLKKIEWDNEKIIFGIDAYYCPWNLAFQKEHINHFIVAISIDKKKETIICIDPFVSSELHEVKIDTFQRMYRNTRIIKDIKPVDHSVIDQDKLLQLLCCNYSEIIKTNTVQSEFEKMAIAIKNVSQWTQLFESEDIRLCSIIREIKLLIGIRSAIAYILFEVEKNDGRFLIKNLYKDFWNMVQIWQEILMSLMKIYLKKELNMKNLAFVWRKILDIGKAEEAVYKNIQLKLSE